MIILLYSAADTLPIATRFAAFGEKKNKETCGTKIEIHPLCLFVCLFFFFCCWFFVVVVVVFIAFSLSVFVLLKSLDKRNSFYSVRAFTQFQRGLEKLHPNTPLSWVLGHLHHKLHDVVN